MAPFWPSLLCDANPADVNQNPQGQAGESSSRHRSSASLCQIKENDDRRIADGDVVACEVEAAGFAIDSKDGDIVAALIAAVEELAGGIDVEAARIVPARPLLADIGQAAGS
jgi:hypothetical protein